MTAIDEFEFQATRVLNEAAASQLPGSFRKVLYVVMLDALAARRFPDVKKNGKRFIRFIRVCGDWPDGERVSLPVAATDDQLDPALRSFVRDRLLGWEDAICGIGNDPLPKDLPAGNLNPFRSCQHVRLLWRFRNALLHEFQEPGLGDVWRVKADEPVYYRANIDPKHEPWSLVFPVNFLARLAERCLKNFLAWCRREGVSPYSDVPTWLARENSEPPQGAE